MAVKRYTKMAYACADDMVFGKSLEPISYGFGLKIGAGEVIPEINYAPRAGTEKDPERLRKEYVDYISKDILNRAVTAGFPNVQLETEWVSQMNQAKLSVPVVAGQKEICEKYHEEYGVNCAVRQTIPDQREAEEGLRPGMGGSHAYPEKLFECAEIACENGADNLSCESVGGKEFADIVAFLFGVGYLGSIDMTYIWQEFSEIAKKNKCIAGGDTNCSGANVSMFMAGGFLDNDVQKTFSAVTRCISAARTLAAWESPVPSVPTRTADTRESSARPSPESPPPRRVRTASAPTATCRVTSSPSAATSGPTSPSSTTPSSVEPPSSAGSDPSLTRLL